jgi:hypothetical protein
MLQQIAELTLTVNMLLLITKISKIMKRIIFILSIFFFAISCKENSPEPSFVVAGNYTAQDYRLTTQPEPYPINGKTIDIEIKSVSKDVVEVNVQAPANDIYSPALNVKYDKALVVENGISNGKVTSYIIYLDGIVKSPFNNVILVYDNKTADYYYTPPGYTKGQVTTRLKLK